MPKGSSQRIVPIGVGGTFWALIKGFTGSLGSGRPYGICILFAPFFLFSAAVFPPFLMLYVLFVLKKEGISKPPFTAFKEHSAWYLGLGICFIAAVFVIYTVFSGYAAHASEAYFLSSAREQGLQLGTKLQSEYALRITTALYAAGFAVYALIFLVFAATASAALNHGSNLKEAFSALWVNLPAVFMSGALLICIFGILERVFAHFKLQAIEAVILGSEYTDLSILFIVIRIYVISSFAIAEALMTAMAFNLLENKALLNVNSP